LARKPRLLRRIDMGRTLKQPVVVENRPGANTTLAPAAVMAAPPDGYTLALAADSTFGADKVMFSTVKYDENNFTPINRIASTFFVLAANNHAGIKRLPDLQARSRQAGQPLFLANPGGTHPQVIASELRRAGLQFDDVPYRGGAPASLATMAGVVMAYARAATWMGACGAGQLTKMVNQICLAGLVQALSEGIAFGERAGLDMVRVLEVIGKGAAQSWQMDNRGKAMIAREFDGGFAIDLLRKDLGLALQEGRGNRSSLPVTALVDPFYAELQAQGGGRWDAASLLKRLR
jgi:hypothetical protein